MRVMTLYNPIAGAGRAAKAGRAVCDALRRAGHEARLAETSLGPRKQWLDPQISGVDLIVVVGGDGAMRLASGAARRSQTPLYHYPVGTENLCAREFGTDRSLARLLAAIERFEVKRFDLGTANDRDFLLMASVGYDAEVVADLAARRGSRITHLTYLAPMLRQFVRFKPPRLSVAVDGKAIVDDREGCLVVGNSRQYARRFDPACRASMTDGLLDVVFFPTRSRRELLRWAIACRLRRHVASDRLIYRLGRAVEVRCRPPQRYQLDGDPPESPAGDETRAGVEADVGKPVVDLRISLCPSVLPVLIP